MKNPIRMVEVWRGGFLESFHSGHAVVCDENGDVVQAWGDPNLVMLPRSSCKMIQALPLIETGAAEAIGLNSEHLALACASHQGAAIHTDRVSAWLADLGMNDADFRCGPQEPADIPARNCLIRAHEEPCQVHNNCSGKHAGFLTVTKYLNASPEYINPNHPLQISIKEAFEGVTGQTSPGFGIDGCSAPNFATTLRGLARAMSFFATARDQGSVRNRAAAQLVQAMMAHPDLVAGEGRACTELMRAMNGRVAIKTGADGVYTAILPDQKLGVALKVSDGARRGSEGAMAAILVKLGVLDPRHPATLKRINAALRNRRGAEVGIVRPAENLEF